MGYNASDVADDAVKAVSAYNEGKIDAVAVIDRLMSAFAEADYDYVHPAGCDCDACIDLAKAHAKPIRFTCPVNPDHDSFYLRRSYSEAWAVSAEGGIATEETKNSFEGEADGPVMCADCDELNVRTEAVDAKPGDELAEDAEL